MIVVLQVVFWGERVCIVLMDGSVLQPIQTPPTRSEGSEIGFAEPGGAANRWPGAMTSSQHVTKSDLVKIVAALISSPTKTQACQGHRWRIKGQCVNVGNFH